MTIITNNKDLKEICKKLSNSKHVFVDTEFMRSKTYYPVLCLLQIADDNDAYIIDCLEKDLDFQFLIEILLNPRITKIFHDPKQDLEVIYYSLKITPYPIYDTQIASKLAGLGKDLSLSKLVNKLLEEELDKSLRYSDWAKRPLDRKQIEYAISDVVFLRKIYQKLPELIDDKKILLEAFKIFYQRNFITDSEKIFSKLNTSSLKKEDQIETAKKINNLREEIAKKLNIPRKHVLKNHVIIDIAKNKPQTLKSLKKIKDINEIALRQEIAQAILICCVSE